MTLCTRCQGPMVLDYDGCRSCLMCGEMTYPPDQDWHPTLPGRQLVFPPEFHKAPTLRKDA